MVWAGYLQCLHNVCLSQCLYEVTVDVSVMAKDSLEKKDV